MVKKADLPGGAGTRKLLSYPAQLLVIHVIAVECKKLRIAALEAVVALSIHVERFVKALVRIVVVAQRRIEFDSRVKQRLVRILELPPEVRGAFASVDIVSQHEDEIERDASAIP